MSDTKKKTDRELMNEASQEYKDRVWFLLSFCLAMNAAGRDHGDQWARLLDLLGVEQK